MIRFYLALLGIGSASFALAQPSASWTQVPSGSSARYFPQMAYDQARDRVVMYGGYPYFGDVWELAGDTWLSVAPGPGHRAQGAMAYDEVRHRCVQFGGYLDGMGNTAQTFEYDGATWTIMLPKYSPPAAASTTMWFDDLVGRTYYYSGFSGSYGTWSWDGGRWRLECAEVPIAYAPAAAFDRQRQVAVLFAGMNSSGYISETWEFDGTTWIKQSPLAASPAGRQLTSGVYFEGIGKFVVFGGYNSGGFLNDTWEWNGTEWTPGNQHGSAAPSGRYAAPLVYDSLRERCVLFGGFASGGAVGDTWVYELPREMEAGGFAVEQGSLVQGNLESLRDPDDDNLIVAASIESCRLEVKFVSVMPVSQTQHWFQIRNSSSRPMFQDIELYSFARAQWELVASAAVGEAQTVTWGGVNTGGSAYWGPFNLVLARANFHLTEDDVCAPTVSIDHVSWHGNY